MPQLNYYGAYFDVPHPGFFKTDPDEKHTYLPGSDPLMHGAQCLPMGDYYLLEDYLESLRENEIKNN